MTTPPDSTTASTHRTAIALPPTVHRASLIAAIERAYDFEREILLLERHSDPQLWDLLNTCLTELLARPVRSEDAPYVMRPVDAPSTPSPHPIPLTHVLADITVENEIAIDQYWFLEARLRGSDNPWVQWGASRIPTAEEAIESIAYCRDAYRQNEFRINRVVIYTTDLGQP